MQAFEVKSFACLARKQKDVIMQFDTLLKGGHLIDPHNGINALKDVAISDGRIAAIDNDIPTSST